MAESTPHVLLVEDNPLDVRLLREACRGEPGEATVRLDHAGDLTTAIEKAHAARYDAVLLDLGLPECDGMETLARFLDAQKGRERPPAVVVLTSVESEEIGREAIALGAQDFLVKGEITGRQVLRSIRYARERQRLHAEQQQALARARLMADALDQAPDAVIITDADGVIRCVNRAFTRITGYEAEEAIGRKPSLLSSGKQSPAFYRKMWDAISHGEAWESELIDRRKSGEFYPCHLHIAPVSDERGRITHYIGIQRDLTEHKLLEEKLRQSQKMEAIGTLTGGIAHDFNNILAGITGNVFLAKRKLEAPEKLRARLETIEELCARAAGMIKKLLAFGRNDMVQMRPLPLNPLLQETQSMLSRLIPENIALRFEICDEPLTVIGDAAQLQQVLLNLFNNARDAVAGRDGGAEIRCRLAPFSPTPSFLRLHPEMEGRRLAHIAVEDNGCGIDAETLPHVTEPFFTTKEVGAGTGLGLSMVEGAVDQHHGVLVITSVAGKGTTVNVYLPLVEEANEAQAEEAREEEAPCGRGETILVADDEATVRDALCELLRALGYRTVCAADGVEALERFRERRDEIRLVLLDVVMPRMGGPESYRRMREIFADLPAIFASGYERTRIPSELLEGGRCIRLHKPFHPHRLATAIRSLLE